MGDGAALGEGREQMQDAGSGVPGCPVEAGVPRVLGTGFRGGDWKSVSCARLASGQGWMPVQVPRQLMVLRGAKAPSAIFLHPYVVRQKAFG